MDRKLQTDTDLLLIFLSECIKLLGELFGLVLPEGLGADQVLLYFLHLEACEEEKQKSKNKSTFNDNYLCINCKKFV